MAALSLTWAPSEVGADYCTGGVFVNGMATLGGYRNVVERTIGDASTVLHFSNIARTASRALSW